MVTSLASSQSQLIPVIAMLFIVGPFFSAHASETSTTPNSRLEDLQHSSQIRSLLLYSVLCEWSCLRKPRSTATRAKQWLQIEVNELDIWMLPLTKDDAQLYNRLLCAGLSEN